MGIKLVASYHQTLCNVYLFGNAVYVRGNSGWFRSSTNQGEDNQPYLSSEEEKAIREKGKVVARNGSVRIYDRELAQNLKRQYPSLIGDAV